MGAEHLGCDSDETQGRIVASRNPDEPVMLARPADAVAGTGDVVWTRFGAGCLSVNRWLSKELPLERAVFLAREGKQQRLPARKLEQKEPTGSGSDEQCGETFHGRILLSEQRNRSGTA